MRHIAGAAAASFIIFAFAACAVNGTSEGSAASPMLPHSESAGFSGNYIKHVVILIQENRSFDNLFARFPGADGTTTGLTHTGASVALHESNLYSVVDGQNGHSAFVTDYDGGKMDGFDRVPVDGQLGTYVYQYVNPAQIAPYWTLAKEYALADRMFQTQGSGSFTAHQDLIRGNTTINASESLIDMPHGEHKETSSHRFSRPTRTPHEEPSCEQGSLGLLPSFYAEGRAGAVAGRASQVGPRVRRPARGYASRFSGARFG